MDIVIAAAGKGTRLQTYAATIPKHIIPIGGRPLLYYLLDAIIAAKFRRCIIVGGHQFEKLAQAVTTYQSTAPASTEFITVNQSAQLKNDCYGTACPLLAVEQLIQGERFVYTMGDHLIAATDLQQMQLSTVDMLIATSEHAQPERFGVVETTSNHQLVRIVEKPTHPSSHQINVGLYTLTPVIFSVLHNLTASSRHEYEMTDALNIIAKRSTVRVIPLQRYWLDLGRPEDITSLEQFLVKANSTTL